MERWRQRAGFDDPHAPYRAESDEKEEPDEDAA